MLLRIEFASDAELWPSVAAVMTVLPAVSSRLRRTQEVTCCPSTGSCAVADITFVISFGCNGSYGGSLCAVCQTASAATSEVMWQQFRWHCCVARWCQDSGNGGKFQTAVLLQLQVSASPCLSLQHRRPCLHSPSKGVFVLHTSSACLAIHEERCNVCIAAEEDNENVTTLTM